MEISLSHLIYNLVSKQTPNQKMNIFIPFKTLRMLIVLCKSRGLTSPDGLSGAKKELFISLTSVSLVRSIPRI